MKSWIRTLCAGLCVGAFILMGIGHASDTTTRAQIEQLKKMIEQQSQTINQLKNRLNQLESQQKNVEVEVSNQKKTLSSATKIPEWVSKIKLHGDFRYRYEYIKLQGKDSVNRNRIRARIGLTAKVNNTNDFHIRLASGSQDPTSTNQTLTGSFSSKHIWLDRAYVDWHPVFANSRGNRGHLFLGKMKNPFLMVKSSSLIWDDDLNPEGGAVTFQASLGNINPFINVGGFWVRSRWKNTDSGVIGGQVGVKPVLGKFKVTAGAGYFGYIHTKGQPAFFTIGKYGFGNTLDADGNYIYDYKLVEAFAQVGTKFRKIPVAVYGDYVYNTDPGDDGWLIGFKVGKCKKKHSWEFNYNYRRVEPDATVGAFCDSDFIGGGTDGKGHKFSAGFQLAKNWKLAATYFLNDRRLHHSKDFDRLQVDMKFRY